MSNRSEFEQTMARFFEYRSQANRDAVLGMLHPQGAFRIAGTPQLGAFTQMVNTPDTIRGLMDQLFQTWDLSGLETTDFYVDGDTALIQRSGTVRYIPNGTSFHTELMDKVTFKDGLIIDYTQFIDTYIAAKVGGFI